MMLSNKSSRLAGRPPQKPTGGSRGESFLERAKCDCEALMKQLNRRGPKFLPGMIKLFSYATYFRSLLQDQKVRDYLMAQHHELLKNLELTLGQLEEQEKSAESQVGPMWTVVKARKQLQSLVTLARTTEPQVISFNKKPLVVVIAARRWKAIVKYFPQAERLACPKEPIENNLIRKHPGTRPLRKGKQVPWAVPAKRTA